VISLFFWERRESMFSISKLISDKASTQKVSIEETLPFTATYFCMSKLMILSPTSTSDIYFKFPSAIEIGASGRKHPPLSLSTRCRVLSF